MEKKRNSFSGSIGFVLAAAGSAVGLGNIWRFPYLAAKDGGGLFLVCYIVLALTFGFALLTTEIAIGRKTKQSPLTAYSKIKKGSGFLGVLACMVPFIILPYYCVIGGWVVKYFVVFLTGCGADASEDSFFPTFIGNETTPIIYMAIFMGIVAFIVFMGVNKGIEAFSKIIMPILLVLVIGIAIYSVTIKHTDDAGVARTGIEGLKVYVVPDMDGMTLNKFCGVVMDAMGQLFFSLSVAMGIMITYGSYVDDEVNLGKSINQIEICDTIVAFLAGVMIIPAVFTFMGREGMEKGGPSLMFATLPKVFHSMGAVGNVIGCLFFAMVLFAAITSAVSVLEAVVSSIMDKFKASRLVATGIEITIAFLAAIAVCLGFNKWAFSVTLPTGEGAELLTLMDYISNNIFMPIVAIGTCILIGWIVKPKYVLEEVEKTGHKFGRKILYIVMIKIIAPLLLIFLFLQSLGIITV